jgi:hypothetical protein
VWCSKRHISKLVFIKNRKHFFQNTCTSICKRIFVEIGLSSAIENSLTRLRYFNYCSFFVPKAKPMNNFDIEDAVLIMLKKLFYQNVFIRIGNPMLYKFYRTYNPLGLVQVYQDFEISGSCRIILRTYPLKELYPTINNL